MRRSIEMENGLVPILQPVDVEERIKNGEQLGIRAVAIPEELFGDDAINFFNNKYGKTILDFVNEAGGINAQMAVAALTLIDGIESVLSDDMANRMLFTIIAAYRYGKQTSPVLESQNPQCEFKIISSMAIDSSMFLAELERANIDGWVPVGYSTGTKAGQPKFTSLCIRNKS